MYKCYILILLIIFTILPSMGSLKGGINYKIPFEYSKLNETELNEKANTYYNIAINNPTDTLNEEISTALFIYTILENKCQNNTLYPIRLGILYDKLGKDRYAKSNFCRAIGINSSNPMPYFYLGEFYIKRMQYRKALKYYLLAYDKGYNDNTETLIRLNEIYTKLGDIENAQKYVLEP